MSQWQFQQQFQGMQSGQSSSSNGRCFNVYQIFHSLGADILGACFSFPPRFSFTTLFRGTGGVPAPVGKRAAIRGIIIEIILGKHALVRRVYYNHNLLS